MTQQTSACDVIRDRALIERYVAGKLSETEAAELESHYLTCARCQEDIRLATAIAAAPVESARRPRRQWAGLGLAIAAGITVVLFVGPWRQAVKSAQLGNVRAAPAYTGVSVRGTAGTADSLFARAMDAYGARRYEAAVDGLDATIQAGGDSAPAEFFRAAALLMLDRNDDAAAGFLRVARMGASLYEAESNYYAAKALIRMGMRRDALAALRRISPGDVTIAGAAAALADSIDAGPR